MLLIRSCGHSSDPTVSVTPATDYSPSMSREPGLGPAKDGACRLDGSHGNAEPRLLLEIQPRAALLA